MQLTVFPNPTKKDISIYFKQKQTNVQFNLTNLSGKVVWEQTISSIPATNNLPLEISHLTTGIYLLTVRSDNGYQRVKLFKK